MSSSRSSKDKSVDWDSQSLSLSDYGDFPDPQSPDLDPISVLTSAQFAQGGLYHAPPDNSHHATVVARFLGWPAPSHDHYQNFQSKAPTDNTTAHGYSGATTSVASARASSLADHATDWETLSQSSQGTVSTAHGAGRAHSVASSVSSAPSRHSRVSNVDTHIHRQQPPRQRYQLPCEICGQTFNGDELADWTEHTEQHLQGTFPSRLRCWFCEDLGTFDALTRTGGDRRENFVRRMEHIREHIVAGEYRLTDMRPDGFLVAHLRKQGLINEQTYQSMLRPLSLPAEVVAAAAASSSYQTQFPPHQSSWHLEPVVEEAGPSSIAASSHRRSKKKNSHKQKGRA